MVLYIAVFLLLCCQAVDCYPAGVQGDRAKASFPPTSMTNPHMHSKGNYFRALVDQKMVAGESLGTALLIRCRITMLMLVGQRPNFGMTCANKRPSFVAAPRNQHLTGHLWM